MYRIVLVGRLPYKLSELEDALMKLLGESAMEIMMESILEYLDEVL